MVRLVEFLLILAAPALVFWSGLRALDLLARWDGRWGRRRCPQMASAPTVERLVEDLRRLEGTYRRIELSDVPAKAARLQAVSLAYDDTLRACCRALDLPEPEEHPLSAVVRLQTEAALAQSGLRW
jgi:hypothetical protein